MKNSTINRLRKFGIAMSFMLVIGATLGLFTKGINMGLAFTGGYLTEFETSQPVQLSQMSNFFNNSIEGKYVLTSDESGKHWVVRQQTDAGEQTVRAWLSQIQTTDFIQDQNVDVTMKDSDYIGAQAGKVLAEQGGLALLTAFIIVMFYLSFRFEWRFAITSLVALLHDIVIVLGVFAWTQLPFDLTVLASLLAIIGYSLNDSIVLADRIREVMQQGKQTSMNTIVNLAVKSTMTRTLITSGTTLATIAALWLLAGASLFGFSVALFTGVVVGTLSSIAVVTSLPQRFGLQADFYQQRQQAKEELEQTP